jgi:hypothetical protein
MYQIKSNQSRTKSNQSQTKSNQDRMITIYIGDNGVEVGEKIGERLSKYSGGGEEKQLLGEQLPLLKKLELELRPLLEKRELLQPTLSLLGHLEYVHPLSLVQQFTVYVNNNTSIKTIKEKVESGERPAFFNVIGDLDSPKYYEVLSFIRDKYTDIKILNICILPEKSRVIKIDVDNQILYNVSAIGNFTDSTILIEYDKIIEIVEKEKREKGEKVYKTNITDKIADILSYYMYVMFINENTRQTHNDILKAFPLEKGIATLAYVDDTTDKDIMANKLTTDYLVGFTESTTIYRQVICDDRDVTGIIDNPLNINVRRADMLTDIAPSRVSELPNLPPRGLTIVIDTGIKDFFQSLKDKLEVKNDDVIRTIYSNVANTKYTLPEETQLELFISRLIAYSYIGQIYYLYMPQSDKDITNLDKVLDEWQGRGEALDNIVDKLNEVLTEIQAKFKSSSGGGQDLGGEPAGGAQRGEDDDGDSIFDNLDVFFRNVELLPSLVVNGVKSAVIALNKVLLNTTNNFILTNNVIYQIIKHNDFSILKNPEAVKDILKISIESSKSLPVNSPYLNIVGSLREVEGINKIDLEIIRLENLEKLSDLDNAMKPRARATTQARAPAPAN